MEALMRNLGMAMGTAIAGSVCTSRMAFHSETLAGLGLDPEVISDQAFLFGFRDAILVAASLCLIGMFTSMVRGPQARQT